MTKTIVKNGRLIDGYGGDPIENGVVVYEENTLLFVGEETSYTSTGEEEIIDAQGGTILPGFIDTHVHMMMEYAPVQKRLETPFSMKFYQAAQYLEKTLQAGITTVRDAGGADLGVKTAVETGLIPGPRMQISISALTITGGHGDGYTLSGQSLDDMRGNYPGAPNGMADGVEEVRKKTREILRAGADVIKVHATGGVLSATDHPDFVGFSPDELEVIVEEAHFRKGRKVMAHAQGREGIKHALRAGIHSIEHGVYLDDESISLFLEKDAFLVPTLLAPLSVLELAEEAGMSQKAIDVSRAVLEDHKESIIKAHKAGVKVAMGTDAGVMPHGTNLRELKLMEEIGLTPMDTIVATTKTAAECLGWEDKVGTLEEGKLADIVIVEGNPLDDIDRLSDNDTIQVVIKDGKIDKNTLV